MATERQEFYFFFGGDAAPSETHRSDDGAVAVGVARPLAMPGPGEAFSDDPEDWRFSFIYSRVFNWEHRLSCRHWSGVIYDLDERFGFEQLMLDAGSGGAGMMVAREMLSPTQLINNVDKKVTVIGDKVNAPSLVAHGRFILNMFKRGDPGVEWFWPAPEGTGKSMEGDELLKSALYGEMKTAFDRRVMELIPPAEEWFNQEGELFPKLQGWPEERKHAIQNLSAAAKQFASIIAVQTPEGRDMFTRRGARMFRSLSKDDIALAHMMCYGAFLIWLRGFGLGEDVPDEDLVGFGGRA